MWVEMKGSVVLLQDKKYLEIYLAWCTGRKSDFTGHL